MKRQQLLDDLEHLPHGARMRRMVDLGRAAQTAAAKNVPQLIRELEQGSFYERFLALQTSYGSRDGALVLRMLADPSRQLRAMATRLVALVCSDEQARVALEAASFRVRRHLLRHLRQRQRMLPVDTMISHLAEHDAAQLSQVLPYASAPVVHRLLLQWREQAGAVEWARLARYHPHIASMALQQDAAALNQYEFRLVHQANAVLPVLAQHDPDAAMDLVRTMQRHTPLGRLALHQLLGQRSREMAALLLESDDPVQLYLESQAHKLDDAQLQTLLARQTAGLRVASAWFRRLAPTRRAALYQQFGLGWRDADGIINHALVGLLPRDLREAEGRRHLGLAALATRPAQRLRYAPLLPWEDAVGVLDPLISNPDAELRAVAWSMLIETTRYHASQLAPLLARMHTRRNEQDPVRLAMVSALANLPPGRWQADHLDALGHVLRAALDAADLSFATANAAERFVVSLLPFHPDWAAAWIATLVQERGHVSLWDMEQRINDDQMRHIAPALLPVLTAWATREREGQLVAAAKSVGRRVRVFAKLLDLLERIVIDTRSDWTAARVLRLIKQHDPERMARLIPALLQTDPSTIVLAPVHQYLHRQRQDLLTPFLGHTSYRGRFSTGKTRFVLPFDTGFHRWTATQQAQFTQTLTGLTRDEKRDSPTLLRAINQLAALPSVEPTRLAQLAEVQNPKLVTRDSALRALGQLDAGQGVPILLEAMDDDRARVAIYVLRRAMLDLPPNRALALLESLPLVKVTVAKEVVRLIGDLRTPAAYTALLRFDQQELHRDVRVALLRALWEHVERPTTWPLLERAAASPDPAIAAGVIQIPADRMSPATQLRLANLLVKLLEHPEPRVRVDVLQRCATLPLRDEQRVLQPALLAALQSTLPDEVSAAAQAMFATYVGGAAPVVGTTITDVLANRRTLHTVVHALQNAGSWQGDRLLPTMHAVLAALETDPLTTKLRITLAAEALPWEELANVFIELIETGELHPEALMTGVRAMASVRFRKDLEYLHAMETRLAARPEPELRRLALALLVQQAQPPHGWDPTRVARLHAFRNDPARLVAAAAQFTFVPEV